ncbi:MAG TPA: hypothetical protein VMB46_05900 [Methanomassiliicoccales archaeon]|nr:hypothetical protein [Methanomassiliicoccales archaeon]
MSPPPEPLNYEEVMKVYREERRTANFTEVRRDFYQAARALVEQLKREHEREVAADPYSVKARSLAQQINKLTEKILQIFDFRAEKIALMAIRASSGGKADLSRLTEEEKAFLESMLSQTKASREGIFGSRQKELAVVAPVAPVAQAPQPLAVKAEELPIQQPIPQTPSAPAKAEAKVEAPKLTEVKEKAQPQSTEVLLRILEDIPSFAGPDQVYRLKKEDVITLPSAIGKALVKRGKAEEIHPRAL